MAKARLLVELDVKADSIEEFVAMFREEFMTRSRSEQGCEQYELWRDSTSATKMTIVEVWSSQADLDTHLAQDWFSIWGPKLEAMQATPLVVRALSSIED
ncbi:antibiotic biosynthesis monooxygenase [Shimia sp. R11_0]|uniref:putative quinol monooxygenase n=1 Tax=Shimia sp. R11_0 TaxID=2821096 RepID=UPI001ADC82B0|nr:antibiotic biosynthesis monooxygenase [Shimia sp. R11_0]MBO9479138.1 antibiotic biosynthesis monooxygenase [Shimia sp. R11_0]